MREFHVKLNPTLNHFLIFFTWKYFLSLSLSQQIIRPNEREINCNYKCYKFIIELIAVDSIFTNHGKKCNPEKLKRAKKCISRQRKITKMLASKRDQLGSRIARSCREIASDHVPLFSRWFISSAFNFELPSSLDPRGA